MKQFICLLMCIMLAGCGKPNMLPIQYSKPINFHVKRCAILQWEYGKQYDSEIPYNSYPGNGQAGIVGNLVAGVAYATSASIARKNNPSDYCVSYGKADQAIFMTSLRDTLCQQAVFNEVTLTNDKINLRPKDVLINVFFKTARVSTPETGYRITLTVELNIKSQGKAPFVRTYLVQSCTGGFDFNDQRHNVSMILLEKIIGGIEEWSKLRP